MQYYTKEEAKRIIQNAPVRLCIGDNSNPNRDALQAAYEMSEGANAIWAVMVVFQIGLALGKRIERARKTGERREARA